MKIEKVGTISCNGGENPLWDPARQVLWFLDNSGCKLHRHDPSAGTTDSWSMPSVITTMVLRGNGGTVVTMRTGIFYFDPETGAFDPIHPLGDPLPYVYNDGKVDRRGRFLIGACTPDIANPAPDGGLFRLDPDRTLTRLDGDIHFSNGPCFAPDDRTFYFSDSYRKICYAYDYDIETGAIANRRPFADTEPFGGLPDGATVDADGLVWIAVYGGGKLVAFGPNGKAERVVDMPVKLVSSVNFGGPALDRLYVTTIAHGALGEPVEPGAGDVYVVDELGCKGVPEPSFAG